MPVDLLESVKKVQEELTAREDAISRAKTGLDLRSSRVKKRERDLDEREKQLGEWEKVLTAKFEELHRIRNAQVLESKGKKASYVNHTS